MKIHNVFILICVIHVSVFGQTSDNHGFNLEKLEKVFKEQNQKSLKEIEEREGADGPWLLQLYQDYRGGRQITNNEIQHVWDIYKKEKSHRIEDKLYAFGLIAEFEDVLKWQKEFDSLALSEDPKFVKTAIGTVVLKLNRGNEREKIVLSNKIDVLERLAKFVEDNKDDTTIHSDAVKIIELAKPYVGKSPPAEARIPDRRIFEPTDDGKRTPNERTRDFSTAGSLLRMIGYGRGLTLAGIIGIFIIAVLIWRRKSK